jgi:two-component system OmpR family sensor kinase
MDINLPQNEKKTLFRFLALYIFFTLVVLSLGSYLYFSASKEIHIQQNQLALNNYANEFIIKLKDLHDDTTDKLIYPRDEKYKTSLYDKEYNLLYSTLEFPKARLEDIILKDNTIIRYIKNPHDYYINTQYVIVEYKDDKKWLFEIYKNIFLYGSLFFIFMIVVGYYLLQLFLKPMKDALYLLDRFIKDTTHELNTPVSTIVTNIEMIDKDKIEDKFIQKSINRIDIGAKTISNLYEDLTFLVLDNKIISHDVDINLKDTVMQRVEYFSSQVAMKKIEFILDLEDKVIRIDEKKIIKVIDNLISNAIKYNKIGGTITIVLNENSLSIEDSGKGILQENIEMMFDRYSRFDKSVGGFGIGLNIVKIICDEYGVFIGIESEEDKYTKVVLGFKK